MTEDKADKAVRKVIINFTNTPFNVVNSDDELIKIDVSDKIPEGYYFSHITVDKGGTNCYSIEFIEREWLRSLQCDIETILDATLVNAKQRESVGALIEQCIYKDRGRCSM